MKRTLKRQLRKQLQAFLETLSPEDLARRSRAANEHLCRTEAFKDASVVMMFLAMTHEIDLGWAMRQAWRQGKTVVVPKVVWESRVLIPLVIRSDDDPLEEDHYGLRHPAAGAGVPLESIDLVVTPGLGFDRRGHRLGRGMAFYDCFFAQPTLRATRCGVAFFEQVVDRIPVCDHDEPVHFLVTDRQVLWPVE